jgi:hypothetical protein
MADYKALTLQSGSIKQLINTDRLIVGAGIISAAGALVLAAAGTDVQVQANKNLSAAAGSGAIDFSSATGLFKTSTGAVTIGPGTVTVSGTTTFSASGTALTVTNNTLLSGTTTTTGLLTSNGGHTISGALTQTTGAVSLTGNAASSFTTSSGALTLTSAVAATWSTTAGALTLNGTGGLSLQGGGVTALAVNNAGTAITVQGGATLGTTGTGNINLPNNGSARFQIEGASVSSNVTAANLGTLTAGSSSIADSLHTHAGIPVLTGLTTTGLGDGDFAYISANNTVSKTDATALASSYVIGANTGTSGAIVTGGLISNAKFTTAGGSPSAGSPVYLALSTDDTSTGSGKLTATVPSTGIVVEVGICIDNSNYAASKTAKVLLQPKMAITL